jgi:hypothetical protein
MLQALARWLDDARHAGVNVLGNIGSATGVAGLEALLEGKHVRRGRRFREFRSDSRL